MPGSHSQLSVKESRIAWKKKHWHREPDDWKSEGMQEAIKLPEINKGNLVVKQKGRQSAKLTGTLVSEDKSGLQISMREAIGQKILKMIKQTQEELARKKAQKQEQREKKNMNKFISKLTSKQFEHLINHQMINLRKKNLEEKHKAILDPQEHVASDRKFGTIK